MPLLPGQLSQSEGLLPHGCAPYSLPASEGHIFSDPAQVLPNLSAPTGTSPTLSLHSPVPDEASPNPAAYLLVSCNVSLAHMHTLLI